ncbi:hypothetical protein L6452_02097 [Arctium lappa]|uniref:Uncharacterized protein n=1 Tax=Arctium lappa TaxID=4217 RepID=A0ACB9FHW9_ARCLA|nr:hypothetical protein L6452_02097 [Arctium lappa]
MDLLLIKNLISAQFARSRFSLSTLLPKNLVTFVQVECSSCENTGFAEEDVATELKDPNGKVCLPVTEEELYVLQNFDIDAELVEDRGFLEGLKDLISDNNPMVVANAVATLAEIQDTSSRLVFEVLRVLDYSRISRHLLVTAGGDDWSVHLFTFWLKSMSLLLNHQRAIGLEE